MDPSLEWEHLLSTFPRCVSRAELESVARDRSKSSEERPLLVEEENRIRASPSWSARNLDSKALHSHLLNRNGTQVIPDLTGASVALKGHWAKIKEGVLQIATRTMVQGLTFGAQDDYACSVALAAIHRQFPATSWSQEHWFSRALLADAVAGRRRSFKDKHHRARELWKLEQGQRSIKNEDFELFTKTFDPDEFLRAPSSFPPSHPNPINSNAPPTLTNLRRRETTFIDPSSSLSSEPLSRTKSSPAALNLTPPVSSPATLTPQSNVQQRPPSPPSQLPPRLPSSSHPDSTPASASVDVTALRLGASSTLDDPQKALEPSESVSVASSHLISSHLTSSLLM